MTRPSKAGQPCGRIIGKTLPCRRLQPKLPKVNLISYLIKPEGYFELGIGFSWDILAVLDILGFQDRDILIYWG